MIKKIIQFSLLVTTVAFINSCSKKSSNENTETDSVAVEVVEEEEEVKVPASPRAEATGEVSGISITIDYGSPSVKGRTIWGVKEEYGKVWRAGANETTSINFSGDVLVGGEAVAAGKYGFFIIPNEEGDWVAILSTQWSQEDHGIWGAMGYNEENDIVRINIMPTWADEIQERLEYSVSDNAINFAWEKARLSIPIEPAPAEE
ncbi:MAG: DUF2911 domain-containing protein [Cyclobacteriaceae bacterium]|nr:DUF2911 domain-containing protein [Cyclobacteriaceae bacterium]